MLKRFLTIILISACFGLKAQNRRTIVITDEKGLTPLRGLEIEADFRPDGPLIQGISDKNGQFVFYRAGAFKLMIASNDTVNRFEKTYSVLDTLIRVKLNAILYSPINPVTITGIFRQRVSEGLNITRVISKEKIAALGAQNLGDVLQNEANISLGQDALLGTSAIVQGIGGQDLKILINGIPVIGRLNGNIDLSQILVNNVERIEIIEGPMSVIYGTDAIGGVINIITKVPEKKINGQLNAYTDNLNNVNLDAGINFALNRKIPVSITGGRYFFGGQDFNIADRHYDWKPKIKNFFTVNAVYQRKRFTHRLNVNYYYENLFDRSDAYYNLTSITGYNYNYYTTRLDNQLLSSVKVGKHNHLEFQNAYNVYLRRKATVFRDLITGGETPVIHDGTDTSTFKFFNTRAYFIHNNPLKNKLKYLAGYDINREVAGGRRISGDHPGITDVAVFGTLEYAPVKSLQVKPSLRVISNSRFGDYFPNSKIRFAPLIPSLQIKYNLTEHLNFRGSYSRGYRAPSLKELFFYFVDINHNILGNQNLEPETSDNFILSFDYRHSTGKKEATKSTIFNFSLFNNIIRKKIQLALRENSSTAYTYINLGQYTTQGVSSNFDFNTATYGTSLSTSLIAVSDQITKSDSVNQNYYVLLQMTWNLSYKIPKKNISITWFSRYTSKQRGYTESSKLYTLPRYYIADLIIQKKIPQWHLDLSGGCKNMFNVTSLQSNVNPGTTFSPHNTGSSILIAPGRVFFVKAAYTFN